MGMILISPKRDKQKIRVTCLGGKSPNLRSSLHKTGGPIPRPAHTIRRHKPQRKTSDPVVPEPSQSRQETRPGSSDWPIEPVHPASREPPPDHPQRLNTHNDKTVRKFERENRQSKPTQ